MTRRKPPTKDIPREELLAWVERVADYLAQDSVPPIAGRILGWLMVCEPAEQSAAEIAAAIEASRGSITTNMQVLTAMGFVKRKRRAGARTEFFRLEEGAWEAVVRRQVSGLVSFGAITRDGLDLLGAGSQRATRIREAQAVFEWLRCVFQRADPPPSGVPLVSDSTEPQDP